MSIGRNILVAFDQLGNALAGGNPDNTISSRIGYYNYKVDKVMPHWLLLRGIVDCTFYPVDGINHCKEAYYSDSGEEFDKGTRNWMIAVLAIIVISFCFVIGIILYLFYLVGLVSPDNKDKVQKVTYRLKVAQNKLKGINHDLELDEDLAEQVYETIPKSTFGVLDGVNV